MKPIEKYVIEFDETFNRFVVYTDINLKPLESAPCINLAVNLIGDEWSLQYSKRFSPADVHEVIERFILDAQTGKE